MRTDILAPDAVAQFGDVFGASHEPMTRIEQRAKQLLEGTRAIVWEGDAQTFQFSFVGRAAEEILGYPREQWTTNPTFWAETVVHPQDRDEAIAFCAIATGACRDHDFIYRAIKADGSVVWLHDIVRVIRGPKGVAERLRGIMIDITDTIMGEQQ